MRHFARTFAALLLVGCMAVLSSGFVRLDPPVVEYGCNPTPPNDRCIVVLRDSIAVDNMPILVTDTVPVGETRTVTIARTLTAGERVVVLGSFEGLTATDRKAEPVLRRAEGIYNPAAELAEPFLRLINTP